MEELFTKKWMYYGDAFVYTPKGFSEGFTFPKKSVLLIIQEMKITQKEFLDYLYKELSKLIFKTGSKKETIEGNKGILFIDINWLFSKSIMLKYTKLTK